MPAPAAPQAGEASPNSPAAPALGADADAAAPEPPAPSPSIDPDAGASSDAGAPIVVVPVFFGVIHASEASGATFVFALIFAWAVKAAVIEPFELACMMQVFFNVTEGQEPQPEWRGRLTQMSDKFRQLGERAVGWKPDAGEAG